MARNIDLTKKEGTIGSVFMKNRDQLLSVKSSAEAFDLVKRLFDENEINTPKSRQILMKLKSGMSYVSTVTYLNNIIMKAQGLGILDSEKDNECVEESEAASGSIGSVPTYYCRDLVFADAPDDSDLKVEEIFISGNKILKDRMPVKIHNEDYLNIQKQNAKGLGSYRFIIYYVDSQYDSKWYDAFDNIEDEITFNKYVDQKSDMWAGFEEDYPEDFAKQFKTYDEWKKHISYSCSEKLKEIFRSSGKLPYQSLADVVKTNDDGVAYVIIGWRA